MGWERCPAPAGLGRKLGWEPVSAPDTCLGAFVQPNLPRTFVLGRLSQPNLPAPGQWVSMGSQNGTQPGLELSSQDIFPSPTYLGQLSSQDTFPRPPGPGKFQGSSACAAFLLILRLVFLLALIVLTESIHHPMRCNPETTPPWEPIAATLTRGQEWTRTAGVDWSSGRRWARAGEGR